MKKKTKGYYRELCEKNKEFLMEAGYKLDKEGNLLTDNISFLLTKNKI